MAKTFIPVFYHICRFWQGGKGIPFADFTRSRRARIRGAPSRRRAGALWRVLRAQNARGSFGCKTHAKNRKTALRRSQGVRGGCRGCARKGGAKRDSLHRCRCGGRWGGRCGERQNKGAHMRSLSADRTAVHSRQRGKRGRSKTPWHTSCENSVQGGILQ